MLVQCNINCVTPRRTAMSGDIALQHDNVPFFGIARPWAITQLIGASSTGICGRSRAAVAAAPGAEGSVAASVALLTDTIRPAKSGARVAPARAGFSDAFLPTGYWRGLAVFGL